jgi:hypothetical protein
MGLKWKFFSCGVAWMFGKEWWPRNWKVKNIFFLSRKLFTQREKERKL